MTLKATNEFLYPDVTLQKGSSRKSPDTQSFFLSPPFPWGLLSITDYASTKAWQWQSLWGSMRWNLICGQRGPHSPLFKRTYVDGLALRYQSACIYSALCLIIKILSMLRCLFSGQIFNFSFENSGVCVITHSQSMLYSPGCSYVSPRSFKETQEYHHFFPHLLLLHFSCFFLLPFLPSLFFMQGICSEA